ncbi:hypothetical protein NE848_14580 [Gramella jeungdoensis]|uniref:CcmD family protein n=1 Tax=Gramella jeungdoensis TaxID=708091 RepID=A0ABT0Z4G1_9FLAO|nr:hypothetical protein [Gramella jeungdoensis]MCM8570619.1 hypothetical protein [Gramella jeungdoensis]
MDSISIYIMVGVCIVIGGALLIYLIKDNAKQERIIEKHTRDIAVIRNSRKK